MAKSYPTSTRKAINQVKNHMGRRRGKKNRHTRRSYSNKTVEYTLSDYIIYAILILFTFLALKH